MNTAGLHWCGNLWAIALSAWLLVLPAHVAGRQDLKLHYPRQADMGGRAV